jgi:hypothetical protein
MSAEQIQTAIIMIGLAFTFRFVAGVMTGFRGWKNPDGTCPYCGKSI